MSHFIILLSEPIAAANCSATSAKRLLPVSSLILCSIKIVENGYHLPVEILFRGAQNGLSPDFHDIACFASGSRVEGQECIIRGDRVILPTWRYG